MAKGETVGRTEPEGGSWARREEIEAERERDGVLKKKNCIRFVRGTKEIGYP